MESISLEEELKDIFNNIKNGKIDNEVFSFTDFKSKYVNLKPRVVVEVSFTDGKSAKIDITKWFEGVVK